MPGGPREPAHSSGRHGKRPVSTAAPCVLAVNAGSSSIKFALYPVLPGSGAAPTIADARLTGMLHGLEPGGRPCAEWRDAHGRRSASIATDLDPIDAALESLTGILARQDRPPALLAIAHRIVHGGGRYRTATLVDDRVLADLGALAALAPLHQPHNLKGVEVFRGAYPAVPQVACFDTAFHADLPALETRFGLDPAVVGEELRRYGFHGLSYQFVCGRLAHLSQRAGARLLMAHLGNGASLCAARDGKSVATTMGFSTLDGLLMGTRCGALDPGVLLHLQGRGWSHGALEDLLYRRSGLLGVSGISADMRTLRASTDPAATFAIELFTHRVVREAGALTAVLGGLDVLAFSGGIGEHDSGLRAAVCARLAYLGVRLDAGANLAADGHAPAALHAPDSAVEIWLVPTDEGRVAAEAALGLVGNPA